MVTGTELKAARDQLGDTQAAFGARFGVDQSTVHRWEKRGVPETGTARMAVESLLATISRRNGESKTHVAQVD